MKAISSFFKASWESDSQLDLFKTHYLNHRDYVRAIIHGLTHTDEIDDLVQDTFTKAWRSFHQFQKKSSFKTWIYSITRHTVYDYHRKHSKEIVSLDKIEEKGFEKDIPMQKLLNQALKKMDMKHREVFVLFYKLGHTQKEISLLANIPEGTVKSRLHHGKKVFEKFLKKNGVSI